MVGKEDASSNSRAPCQVSGNHRMFLRSASWSSSRAASQNPSSGERDCGDPNGNVGNNNGQNRRFPAPLTPRSQHNFKARSCLPPLQPLAIARRSLDEWPKAGSDDIGEWPGPPTPSGRGSGERLKLDLSSIERNPDKNGGLVKRDKIASFDKECSKVADHIYLGGDAVAKDKDILKQNGITHVLNCVGFVCPEYFKDDFMYRTLWLQDSPSEDITSILYDVFDYFEDVREQGGRVFVHCCQGVSRSTSLVIAYLMWREGQSFDDAFQYVKAARGIADPNMGFACQLLQCQKRVHAFPLSPSSVLRMYRMAPHSSYDPLHLVPKMLNDPSSSALDSRGAFIVHIPSAIYVWIGKNCETIMEKDARGAVCQIVRYERVQGPVRMIKEGEEPAHFWDAFKHLLPLMEKPSDCVEAGELKVKIFTGDRKVDSYNVDFEIFQKAIKGGFVPPFASSENEHETQLPARESSWSALRLKFASVDMKEFVAAPKLYLSRVYSDSRMIGHPSTSSSSPSSSFSSSSSPSSSVSSSSLSSSSSASSPSYLSPNSICSDSGASSKYLSESSLDSPAVAWCSLPVSSTLPNFSNLSLLSSKISNGPETVGVNLKSQPRSKSTSSVQSKVFSPSLAERRGSLSKSLRLPLMADNMRVAYTPSNYIADQEDRFRMNNNTCSPCELDRIEDKDDFTDANEGGVGDLTKSWKNHPLGNDLGSSVSNGMEESGSAHCNSMQPLVCRWPSLEKIATFGATDMNSKDALAIFFPDLGKNENRILYFWVGRSFDHDASQIQLDSDIELDDRKELDWKQIGRDALNQMGLPRDTAIKIVKEYEEPMEFLALLSSL